MTVQLTISQREAAAMIGVSVQTLRREVDDGKIAFVMVGKRRRFKPIDIADYLDRQTDISEAPPCRSFANPARPIGITDLSSAVVDFTARLDARRSARPRK